MAKKDRQKAKAQKIPEKPKPKPKAKFTLPFGKRNYVLFAIGLAIIVIGYIALGYGDITLAPILLVLGYCVVIPIAIIISPEKKQRREQPPTPKPQS